MNSTSNPPPGKDSSLSPDPWTLLDTLPDSIAIFDAKGQIQFRNTAWATLNETYSTASSSAADAPEALFLAQPDDAQAILNGLRAVLDARAPYFSFDYAAPPATDQSNGQPALRWLRLTIAPWSNAGTRGALVQRRDITAEKVTEMALRESQAYLDAIFRESLDAFIVLDSSTSLICSVSHATQRLLGYMPEALIDQPFSVLFPEERISNEDAVLAQLRVHSGVFEAQAFRAASGETVLLDLTTTLISRNNQRAILVVLRDAGKRWSNEQVSWRIREDLAARVDERTMQLSRSNQQLQQEAAERSLAEQALRVSEARLQHLLSSSPVVIFSSKASGDFGATFVSDNITHVFGYQPQEFTSDSAFWANHIHPDDAPRLFTELSGLFEVGYHLHEYRFLHQDGSYRWVQNQLRLLYDEAGQPVEVIGSLQDITDRKQSEATLQQAYTTLEQRVAERTAELRKSNHALHEEIAERWRVEEALRQSEEQLRRVVQHMPVLMDAFDTTGNIVVWNAECERVTGYTASEVIDNPRIMELFYPDENYRTQLLQEWSDKGHNYRNWEWEITAKDGSVKTIAWSNISEHFPIPGWATWGIGVDVTERKQAEHIQEVQLVITSILAESTSIDEALPRLLQTICERLKWTFGEMWQSNAADALRLTYSWQQPKGGNSIFTEFRQSLAFEHGQGLIGHVWESQQAGWISDIQEAETNSIQMIGAQEAIQHSLYSVFAFPVGSNKNNGVMCFFANEVRLLKPALATAMIDIGRQVSQFLARRQAEVALEAERASLARRVAERTADLSVANAELARAVRTKDEFLANMSHELRTPLNAVLGLSEALQEEVYGALNERQRTLLQTIEESGRHLLALINDILDLSKIEAGKSELDITLIGLEDMCQASLRMIRQSASKKRISVAENLDYTIQHIQADERRLKQILVNLLSNAVKFTPERGMIGLDVIGDREHHIVRFTVWDTGIGIPDDKMDRLFKPFVQIDSKLSKQYAGTGLGLALVGRLTEMHGGSLSVESEVGKGSRFTVSLPWHGLDRQPMLDEEPETESLILAAHGLAPAGLNRALLVEDSTTAADQLRRYLQDMGIETIMVTDEDDATFQAAQNRPDIIILDILLPGKSGWEIMAELKGTPATKSIPILIISNVDDQLRGMKLGASGYVVKPISRQELHKVLQDIFANNQPNQSDETTALLLQPQPDTAPETPLILLAEDNEDSSMLLSEYLETKGYRVAIARNGSEAIERVRATVPALILMDIQMPGMDGLEAIRHIRADADLAHIPIVAVTALAMAGDRERCIAAGANEYISKPISLKQLMNLVKQYLSG
jgi:PAS domain S-box-containing protein